LLRLDSSSKESGDQFDLSFHIAFYHPLYLALPDHVHDLEPLQGPPRGLEGKETHPWLRQTFDEPVILLDEIVEVFHLSQFTVCGKRLLCLKHIEGFGIGGVFVDVDHARCHRMSSSKGCQKEALCGFSISRCAEPKIERVSL
jgi:hypothetical protein